jgi:hypothetical protein
MTLEYIIYVNVARIFTGIWLRCATISEQQQTTPRWLCRQEMVAFSFAFCFFFVYFSQLCQSVGIADYIEIVSQTLNESDDVIQVSDLLHMLCVNELMDEAKFRSFFKILIRY